MDRYSSDAAAATSLHRRKERSRISSLSFLNETSRSLLGREEDTFLG
jgi:hypothetical protein